MLIDKYANMRGAARRQELVGKQVWLGVDMPGMYRQHLATFTNAKEEFAPVTGGYPDFHKIVAEFTCDPPIQNELYSKTTKFEMEFQAYFTLEIVDGDSSCSGVNISAYDSVSLNRLGGWRGFVSTLQWTGDEPTVEPDYDESWKQLLAHIQEGDSDPNQASTRWFVSEMESGKVPDPEDPETAERLLELFRDIAPAFDEAQRRQLAWDLHNGDLSERQFLDVVSKKQKRSWWSKLRQSPVAGIVRRVPRLFRRSREKG